MNIFTLFVVVLLATGVLGEIDENKNELLYKNRVPKEPTFNSVCSECKMLMKRVVEVAKDPTKLAELKILLNAMCHETSYEEECHIFVSKLDFFLKELTPYMKNATKVCKDLHLCANRKIDLFHRVGLLYAKKYMNKIDGASDLICSECEFSVKELQEVVDNRSVQIDVLHFLSNTVCAKLGQYRGSCDVFLDDFLPDLWQELHNLLQEPREFCEHLELCKPTAASQRALKVSQRVFNTLIN